MALIDENGSEFVYPTAVDAYDAYYAKEVQAGRSDEFFNYLKKARHDYEDADNLKAIANRRLLKETMESIGLKALPHEWWHYELPDGRTEKYPMIQN